jgi:outer membrane protein assembly factor BamA
LQVFSLSYSFARIAGDLPTPIDKLDPYETPSFPVRGTVGSVHVGYGYSNAQSYLWSVGPERGMSVSASFDLADKALASDFSGFTATAQLALYYPMPWLQHHALALHASTGTAAGSYPGRGTFYVGGFVDEPVIDTVRSSLIQGGIVLRGYPVVAEVGRNYALFNAEYRFPIVNVDRGPSTLPFFFNRLSGSLFVDYGSAFDDVATAKFKTGTGGELWFDFLFGYVIGLTFRAGFAHGWASEGIEKLYFIAAVPF